MPAAGRLASADGSVTTALKQTDNRRLGGPTILKCAGTHCHRDAGVVERMVERQRLPLCARMIDCGPVPENPLEIHGASHQEQLLSASGCWNT